MNIAPKQEQIQDEQSPTRRKTLQTSQAKSAMMKIVLLVLPIWGLTMLLSFFMPFTGIIGSVLAVISLFILPFKAKQGCCPNCDTHKIFPFSGFGNACKGCGQELVLRGNQIHLLEEKGKQTRSGSGRGNR